jgi:thioesterase domain-containing protein
MSAVISTVRSKDGTSIASDRVGDGPPLIVVVGAFNDRSTGAPLAQALASSFSVVNYDRRGRGASGDTPPYAIEREIEDLDALIDMVGGDASVFGYSSGATLVLEAAAAGSGIGALALYDLPPPADDSVPPFDHATRLARMIAEDRRGDAVEYFQSELAGLPAELVIGLRHAPFRHALESMAHTLVYEATIVSRLRSRPDLGSSVTVPTLAVAAGSGSPVMPSAARAVAAAIPGARAVTLEGQTHDIDPDALGPILERFFLGARS